MTNGGPVIAERANATTLDQQQQAEFRQNQKTLLGYLNGAIDGTAPSVAKLQLDEATQRNEANQLGLASAASRGGNSALAMRTAANNIGMINQKAAADAALLRAQEIATARGQYGDVANSGRTTDVSIAGQNAGLQTGVSQSNAQLGTTANITGATLNQKTSSENAGNAVAVNSLQAQLAQAAQTTNANNNLSAGTTNATLGTQVATSNAKNQLDAQSLQAQLNQQASTANAGNSLAAQTTNATLGTQASVTNANNQTSASIATANNATQASVANANNSLAAQIAQAKLTQDASTSNAANATSLQQLQAQLIYNASHDNAGNALSAAQTNANLQTQASTTNATNATSLNVNQGQLSNAANLANAANQVATAGQDITARQNAAGNSLTASGQTIQGQSATLNANTELQKAQMAADAQTTAAQYGAAGSALGVLASDRRLKTDVSDGKGSAQDLLNHLSAKSFRYKDGGDRQTGVMAQDVEKSPAGKTFVRETSRGKALDPVAGFGSVLAMLSTLNDRMKKIEGGRRATST
ncbi:MAG: tail fiber domain-containing protein [Myxococcales bacterium]